jgi:hypothetical protein
MSSVMLGGPPLRAPAPARVASPPSTPPVPPTPPQPVGEQRGSTLTVIAGVGVLLLAMGVGVLIGRSSASNTSTPAPAQVISVASTPSTGAATGASEATFAGDWPAGSSGYAVELQMLPVAGTSVSAVEAAKSSATGKGATAVGALKSEEFSSLPVGSYIVYSGHYSTRAQAESALSGLRKSFPAAAVIHVAGGAGEGSSSSSPASGSSSPSSQSKVPPSSESHPAPSSVLKSLNNTKGKSYEEKSKNLPNVVETG